MKSGLGQKIASAAVFVAVLVALASVDTRVRERFDALWSHGSGLSPWGERVADFGTALVTALRTQSIENAPVLVFAAVGGILVIFMLRT